MCRMHNRAIYLWQNGGTTSQNPVTICTTCSRAAQLKTREVSNYVRCTCPGLSLPHHKSPPHASSPAGRLCGVATRACWRAVQQMALSPTSPHQMLPHCRDDVHTRRAIRVAVLCSPSVSDFSSYPWMQLSHVGHISLPTLHSRRMTGFPFFLAVLAWMPWLRSVK